MARRLNEPREDLRALSALADLGRALGGAADFRAALERMLEKLESARGVLRGARNANQAADS